MIIRNFLKTAVLGIAFCSVFGMSNGIAAQNVQFQDILNELAIYHHEVLNDLQVMKMPTTVNIDRELDNFLKDKLLEIIDIMERTINNNVNEQDFTNLVNNFEILQNTSCHNTNYAFDIPCLLRYSAQIIQEVQNHMPAHMVG